MTNDQLRLILQRRLDAATIRYHAAEREIEELKSDLEALA
jgi:hypothetical protein